MRGSMEGWKDHAQKGQLIMLISIFDISYNYPGSYHRNKYYIKGHRFHSFKSFLARDSPLKHCIIRSKRGKGNRKDA